MTIKVEHTGDKLPIMRNAVKVESNRNAILLECPILSVTANNN